jgi:hypothetical protein
VSLIAAIFFPDLSHYDADRGVTIQPDTVAVIVKASHGTRFVDRTYSAFKQQAADRGCYFTAYHWLNHGGAAAQAAYCYAAVGRTPVMVDAEDMPGNTGYAGPLTVADIAGFVTELRRLGGVSNLVYLPRWYWADHMGSPDLRPLGNIGVRLVSSSYTTYSDSGPGWAAYGGLTPVQWQYTNALPYSGSASDFNAFRGTLDEYKTLTQGGLKMSDWSGLGQPPNFPFSADVATVDVNTVLRLGDKTGWDPDDGAGWWLVKKLRDMHTAIGDVTKAVAAVQADVDVLQAGGVDVDALAAKITAALIASGANGLTAADHDAVIADVKTALRQGVGA